MHKVLPTTLCKKAILKAETELRVYYQHTVTAVGLDPGHPRYILCVILSHTSTLPCMLKYLTLSDTDKNPDAENHVNEHILADSIPSPKQEVLSPASLYDLTAIIE
ncbi:uncharacterized protein BJ212DRAFT_1503239 [Suillus subaureus]